MEKQIFLFLIVLRLWTGPFGPIAARTQVYRDLANTQVVDIDRPLCYSDGLKDGAMEQADSFLWMLGAFFIPIPAIIGSAAYTPEYENMKALALNKSLEYAKGYSNAYMVAVKTSNMRAAGLGARLSLTLTILLEYLLTITDDPTADPPRPSRTSLITETDHGSHHHQ